MSVTWPVESAANEDVDVIQFSFVLNLSVCCKCWFIVTFGSTAVSIALTCFDAQFLLV